MGTGSVDNVSMQNIFRDLHKDVPQDGNDEQGSVAHKMRSIRIEWSYIWRYVGIYVGGPNGFLTLTVQDGDPTGHVCEHMEMPEHWTWRDGMA